MAKNQSVDDYFGKLVEESNKRKREFKDKAETYLEKIGFFALKADDKLAMMSNDKILRIIQAAAKENFNLVEIARIFSLTSKDFIDQMSTMPEISDAMTLGWSSRNTEVEDAMHKLATGYEFDETTVYTTETGNRTLRKTASVKKRQPPNYNAAKYWLEYKSKQEYSPLMKEVAEIDSNSFRIKVLFSGDKDGEDDTN